MSLYQEFPNTFSPTQETQEVLKNHDNEFKKVYVDVNNIMSGTGHAHTGSGSDGSKISYADLENKPTIPTALTMVNVPAGDISAVTVQDAINELNNKKATTINLNNGLSTKVNQSSLDNTNISVLANTNALINKASISYVDTKIGSVVGGTPKGVYATLALLQSAYPSGTTGTYIVSADGKWYYWGGSWIAGGVYQSTGIADNSIAPIKLNFIPVAGDVSKNLFNKATITGGRYVDSSGNHPYVGGWDYSDFIPTAPNTVYAILTTGDYRPLCFFDANHNPAGGLDYPGHTVTTPSNGYYIQLSMQDADINGLMFYQYNGTELIYEKYGATYISKTSIANRNLIAYKNIIIVAKSGGDYTSISYAVYAESGNIPLTIILCPGVYYENINIIDKSVSIIGVNKNTCIIRDDSGNYNTPPLALNGGCYIANVSIISTHNNATVAQVGYAVHCDYAGAGIIEFNNCILSSAQAAAIGIGLHQDQTVILSNCELIKNDADMPYPNGALYCHNQQWDGATNQHLIVKNCSIKTDTGAAVVIEDANHRAGGAGGDARDTTVAFYNTIAYSKTLGKIGIVTGDSPLAEGCLSGYIKLTDDSFGNNVAELNV